MLHEPPQHDPVSHDDGASAYDEVVPPAMAIDVMDISLV
jgi:hypothetical protein